MLVAAGVSSAPQATPSIVSTSRSSHVASKVKHDNARRPSITTVHTPALTVIATLLRARKVEPLAQCIEQRYARVDVQVHR